MYQSLYSQNTPEFENGNAEIMKAVNAISKNIGNAGIWVIDRGGDRRKILNPLIESNKKLIIRIRGDRHGIFRGKRRSMEEVALVCPLVYADRVVKESTGKEKMFTYNMVFAK